MRPRKLTEEGYQRIEAVARRRDAIPTDKDLAKELEVSEGYIRQVMAHARKSRMLDNVCDVSYGTSVGHTAQPGGSHVETKAS